MPGQDFTPVEPSCSSVQLLPLATRTTAGLQRLADAILACPGVREALAATWEALPCL